MKRIISFIFILMLILTCSFAEGETTIKDVYDFQGGETFDAAVEYSLSFYDQFSLTIPAGWQIYELTEAQINKKMFTCIGDGTHFMFISREENNGVYVDIVEYGLTLTLDDVNSGVFETEFGGEPFVCYSDYTASSSNCATMGTDNYIYTFYFYPIDGDTDFAQTVMNLMGSYKKITPVAPSEGQ